MKVTVNQKDAVAGVVFAAVGGWFAVDAWLTLEMGSALRMGPGFYPLLVGLILLALGLAIAIRAVASGPSPVGALNWRGMILITLSPLVFGLILPGFGFVPAVIVAAAVASFASRRARPPVVAAVSIGLAAFCVAVFVFGLGLPLRIIGPWLGG